MEDIWTRRELLAKAPAAVGTGLAASMLEPSMVEAKDKPAERIVTLAAANGKFVIPPGDSNFRVDSKITLQDDSTLIMMLPHMHLRGKSFEYRITYPTGEKETILSVPHYSFSWQLSYYLDKPRLMPKGTSRGLSR